MDHKPKVLKSLLFAGLSGLTATVSAEAVLNPNQISGTIRFTNTNPAILNIFSQEGLNHAFVKADSIGVSPTLSHYSYPQSSDQVSANYELTVEASSTGIQYNIGADLRLDNSGDRYQILPTATTPVFPEPADNVTANMNQCAAMLDVRFVDKNNAPVAVNGGYLLALKEQTPGKGDFRYQAQDFRLENNSNQEYLAVQGDGSLYRVDMVYEFGSDPYSNKVRGLCREQVTASCDQVVPLTCVISDSGSVGSISGKVAMQGQTPNLINGLTRMRAFNGPLQNYRFDQANSAGDYLLENLVPSDADSPSRNYMVYGELSFGQGYNTQYIRTPWLDGYRNNSVRVEAGQNTDLGNTFVMQPGYINGSVELAGPVREDSLLADLYRDIERDHNGDNIPDDVYLYGTTVKARGAYGVADGATSSSYGAEARTLFPGEFDASSGDFSGSYELVLGGLNGENSLWTPNELALKFIDQRTPDVPESFQYNWMRIINSNIGNHQVTAGSQQTVDHKYCMSEVMLTYRSLSGLFFNPRASANGSFAGTDHLGKDVNYSVHLSYALGTPWTQNKASNTGMVAMMLPQGHYVFTPHVSAVNPNGGYSNTELPPVEVNVGCQQVLEMSTELQVNLDQLPQQSDEQTLVISGTVSSDTDVKQITYTHNSNDAVTICSDCVPESQFMAEVTLDEGENTVVVTAESSNGDTASVTTQVDYQPPEPEVVYDPVSISGCNDISATIPSHKDGDRVDFTIKAAGGCSVPKVSCDYFSDDFFELGDTKVNCQAADSCGDTAQCSFTVSLQHKAEEQPEAPDSSNNCTVDSMFNIVSATGKQLLWPPNHNLVDVQHSLRIDADCEQPKEQQSLWKTGVEIWSNEPELDKQASTGSSSSNKKASAKNPQAENKAATNGSGNFAPDAKHADDKLRLRAERSGNGDGRVYLIINLGVSSDDNVAVQCSAVVVPHSQSQASINAVNIMAKAAVQYCEDNQGQAPAGWYQHGLSEEVGPKQ